MSKIILLSMVVLIGACAPVAAQQQDRQFTAAQGETGYGWQDLNAGRTSDVSATQMNDPGQFYVPPPDNTHTQTTAQSSYQDNFRDYPLTTVSSMPFSGAERTSIPITTRVPTTVIDPYGNEVIVDKLVPMTDPMGNTIRANVYAAPGNFAARQWGGGMLYPTVLDSIVAESGYNFEVFGDEGTQGPPPLSDFGTIDSGVFATTGHPSDAPSAWGYPN